MIKSIQKYPLLTIALFTLAFLLPNLDALEVSFMETRNFISAREMLSEGNWILTTLNGEARYSKPPLPTWITALFGYLFGLSNVWALRLPGVLMIMVLGMGVFRLSRKLNLTIKHSLNNGLITITSAYVVFIIFDTPWDIYAVTFMLWSIYFMICWFQKEKVVQSGILAIIFMGASILSKGPVALYVMLLPFLIAYLSLFGFKGRRKRFFYFIGILFLGLVIGFSWYYYVRFADIENFTRITSKETSNWASYNVRPFYYYWNFFIQSGVWTLPAFVSLLYPYLKSRVTHLRLYQFTLVWTLLALILLSIIPEKKSRYLMPVLIPLALNCGFYIEYLLRNFRNFSDWKEKAPVYVHFGLIGLVFIGAAGIVKWAPFFEEVPGLVYILLVVPCLIGILLLRGLFKNKDIEGVFYGAIFGMLVMSLAISPASKRPIVNKEYKDFKELHNPLQVPLYAYKVTIPELIWEYGKKIPSIDQLDLTKGSLEPQFMVLECSKCEYQLEKDFEGYQMELIDSINLNKGPIGGKNYKYRKKARIFLVTRE